MDKVWYRSTLNGERGYLVESDGEQTIVLDRPGDTTARKFDPKTWLIEAERKPLMRAQVAQVTLAADNAVCLALGLHKEAKKDWKGMKDADRIRWMERGPKGHRLRKAVHEAIVDVLGPECE